MRTPFIAGNWKMFKTVADTVKYVKELRGLVKDVDGVEIVLAPPFTALYAAAEALRPPLRRSQSAVKRRAAILDGLQHSLAHGITCVADTGNYEGILQIVQDTGLRLHISPEVAAGETPGKETFFDRALAMVEEIEAIGSDRVHVGLSPLSPYALSRQLLKILAQHAPLHPLATLLLEP